ncbi:MAG: SpoIIE family protein phosphatase [Spirochaetaceae bacterium]|nr:SpoIIE family protein phosphatase [Spirochaetaceae bacterium]
MKLKTRILVETLSVSLAFIAMLSVMFFLSVAGIRHRAFANSGGLGDRAAEISSRALEERVTENSARIAQDVAVILDEKLLKIENHTRMTAGIAGSIYTRRGAYRPLPLREVRTGETPGRDPYIHAAPGVDLSRIRDEAGLAGNIGDVLRQITVIEPGITTSTIGGEAGYIIAMDAFPWPQADFDPRRSAWYTGARERGDLYWTGIYADLRGRGPAISAAMPFYETDGAGGGAVFRGVARSTVLLSDLTRIIESARVGRTGYLFLLDESGMKLFSSGSVSVRLDGNGNIVGENWLESAVPRQRSLAVSMTLGAAGMTECEIDGVRVYAAYAPIQTLGWSLGVAIPGEEIAAPARLIGEQILSLTGEAVSGMDRYIVLWAGIIAAMVVLTLLFAAFLAVRFSSAVTRPILLLHEGVREVSGGNLDREVIINTGDELEQLAASFNTMTEKLRGHIARTAAATAEKERIATELDVAVRIQTSMLPVAFPPFPGKDSNFDLYAAVYPAREVGGDFYDFFFIDDDHVAIIAADVSGKGIPASLFMAITRTLIKNHLQGGEALEEAVRKTNRQLSRGNAAEMFVTLWAGVLSAADGKLTYINAGHTPPLIRRGRGPAGFLRSPPDLVLAGMEDTAYRRRETRLDPGDMLLLYTDGITEAADRGENFYGRERLRRFFDGVPAGGADLSAREYLARLRADIAAFADGAEQSDDITMLLLHMNPQPAFRAFAADTACLPALIAFIGGELDRARENGFAPCPDQARGQIELAVEEIFVNIARYAYRPLAEDGVVIIGDAISGETEDGVDDGVAISGDAISGETEDGVAIIGDADNGGVEVTCGIARAGDKTVMRAAFADTGTAFNPLEHEDPDITAPLAERETGGLGLLIVKRTMDTIIYKYDGGKNRLVITKSW